MPKIPGEVKYFCEKRKYTYANEKIIYIFVISFLLASFVPNIPFDFISNEKVKNTEVCAFWEEHLFFISHENVTKSNWASLTNICWSNRTSNRTSVGQYLLCTNKSFRHLYCRGQEALLYGFSLANDRKAISFGTSSGSVSVVSSSSLSS